MVVDNPNLAATQAHQPNQWDKIEAIRTVKQHHIILLELAQQAYILQNSQIFIPSIRKIVEPTTFNRKIRILLNIAEEQILIFLSSGYDLATMAI
jgi:hypothetical protein